MQLGWAVGLCKSPAALSGCRRNPNHPLMVILSSTANEPRNALCYLPDSRTRDSVRSSGASSLPRSGGPESRNAVHLLFMADWHIFLGRLALAFTRISVARRLRSNAVCILTSSRSQMSAANPGRAGRGWAGPRCSDSHSSAAGRPACGSWAARHHRQAANGIRVAGLSETLCQRLRVSARRFARPAGHNPRRELTQNWIETGARTLYCSSRTK